MQYVCVTWLQIMFKNSCEMFTGHIDGRETAAQQPSIPVGPRPLHPSAAHAPTSVQHRLVYAE